jgi:amidase
MTPFDIGTDLTGSIRIPAHFCGLFGLKPTEHRVPLTGIIPGLPGPRTIRIMSCIGPMARDIEDLQLLYTLIAGPDGQDTEVAPIPTDDAPEITLKRLRIAVAPTLSDLPVAHEIRAAIETLAQRLTGLGASVEYAELPLAESHQDLAGIGALLGMMLGAAQPEEQQRPTPLVAYFDALDQRDRSIMSWERFFDEWDVLLCPPAMTSAFPHCDPGSPLRVDGQNVPYEMISAHSALFNYTGHPALVAPLALDHDGLPIGIQLVGKRWSESQLLAIAAALSAVTGPFRRPPGY